MLKTHYVTISYKIRPLQCLTKLCICKNLQNDTFTRSLWKKITSFNCKYLHTVQVHDWNKPVALRTDFSETLHPPLWFFHYPHSAIRHFIYVHWGKSAEKILSGCEPSGSVLPRLPSNMDWLSHSAKWARCSSHSRFSFFWCKCAVSIMCSWPSLCFMEFPIWLVKMAPCASRSSGRSSTLLRRNACGPSKVKSLQFSGKSSILWFPTKLRKIPWLKIAFIKILWVKLSKKWT